MKASEFIRVFGLDIAIMAVEECPSEYELDTVELKRLVESHELVESKGGIELSKKEVRQRSIVRWVDPEVERLREAIADVEACKEVL